MMSNTTRKHEPPSSYRRKGPKNKAEDPSLRAIRKTPKQRRPNERAALRKEYL